MWTSPDGQYQNQIDYILCSQRWRSSIQSAKTRPGVTVDQIKLLLANFRLKLKKVGKTTRPFRYDLNQIPYDYTMEVTNRFKGLDLIECLKNYGWRFVTLYRGSRPSPRKKMQKDKMVVWGGLTNCWGKRRSQRQKIKENAKFQKIARRYKKAFLSEQCWGTEENNRMGKTSDLLKKIGYTIPRKHFMQRWAQ